MADSATIPEGDHPLLAGRYRVVRRLGAGGMGEVFLVEDLKLDGRHFAVKMLPSFLSGNRRAMASLKREALHAMELSHPHIVTVRGFEETEAGQPFLVMDYIEGRTLEDLLVDRERLPEDEVIRLFAPIAEALDHAHSKGVIHRDVKPSNIMIRTDGTPVIMDFGVAREVKETSTLVTGAETASGTLPYMSPEQLRGERPTPSQDIYSLAATMWECVVGEPPFCRGDIRHQIETVNPSPPDWLGESISDGILAALAKSASARPVACAGVIGLGAESGVSPGEPFIEREIEQQADNSGGRTEPGGEDRRLLEADLKVRRLDAEIASMVGSESELPPDLIRNLEDARHLKSIAIDRLNAGQSSSASLAFERAIEAYEVVRCDLFVHYTVSDLRRGLEQSSSSVAVEESDLEVDRDVVLALPSAVRAVRMGQQLDAAVAETRLDDAGTLVPELKRALAQLRSDRKDLALRARVLHDRFTGGQSGLVQLIHRISEVIPSAESRPEIRQFEQARDELASEFRRAIGHADWDKAEVLCSEVAKAAEKVHADLEFGERVIEELSQWTAPEFDSASAPQGIVDCLSDLRRREAKVRNAMRTHPWKEVLRRFEAWRRGDRALRSTLLAWERKKEYERRERQFGMMPEEQVGEQPEANLRSGKLPFALEVSGHSAASGQIEGASSELLQELASVVDPAIAKAGISARNWGWATVGLILWLVVVPLMMGRATWLVIPGLPLISGTMVLFGLSCMRRQDLRKKRGTMLEQAN